MNVIDKLMQFDAGKLEIPTGEVKIKLNKLGGEEFIFPIQALNPALAGEIAEESMNVTMRKGSNAKVNLIKYRTQLRTIVEGCPVVFKNQDLQKKFGARTPSELVEKLMLSGEMDKLSEAIENLSGYEDEVDDVKNL